MTRFPCALLLLLAVGPMTAHPASAFDSAPQAEAPDLASVRNKIKVKDWPAALAELTVLSKTVQHADVCNLLGFVNRNMGEHTAALAFYTRALDLDPRHRGAREYLGELFVKTGDMAKAKQQEVVLSRLCPDGCEELEDLRHAIASGPGTAASLTN